MLSVLGLLGFACSAPQDLALRDEPALTIPLLAVGRSARLGARGMVLSDPGSGQPVLTLRTRSWGRAQHPVPAGEGLREWWTGLDQGLEQGWTVDTRPEGPGALRIAVAVEGARELVVWADGARWRDAGGQRWNASAVGARDADGVALPAWLEGTAEGLTVVVDDTAARYPLEVDPVYTTAVWMTEGQWQEDDFGAAVASAGDVNGDGYADAVVGAPDYRRNTGRAHLYLGSAAGLEATASTPMVGETEDSAFSAAVAGAGDVDGDGYDDVIVGAQGYDDGTGRVYLFLGSATGLSDTPATTLTGPSTGSAFGHAVSGAGDVNGDGYDDVIVGAGGSSGALGRAMVYLGSATGLSTTAATTLGDDTVSVWFGGAVSAAGDVDGDGYDDVAVGDISDGEHVWIDQGSAGGVVDTAETTLSGEGGNFGSSVAALGDTNGDGYDEIVVGAPSYSSARGRAYVFYGGAGGLDAASPTLLKGEGVSDHFGAAVSGAGDVNGDGFPDVVVGAYACSSFAGRAYVYPGSATGVHNIDGVAIGRVDGGSFGMAVAGLGDVDGDGADDVAISDSRDVQVLPGSVGGLDASAATALTGSTAGQVGASVAGVGDVNGDGYADFVVGGPGTNRSAGEAQFYLGAPGGLSSTADLLLAGDADLRLVGDRVSEAGDVDGDGYDDVLVRTYDLAGGGYRVDVHAGSAGGLAESPGTSLRSPGDPTFGKAIASAGDLDGDGYDDVVVGSYEVDGGTGQVMVYRGSAAGLMDTASLSLTGEGSTSWFGYAVDGAGDVDGDGYDDLVVGAWEYGSGRGRVYLYRGSATGLSTTADTVLDGAAAGDNFGEAVAGLGDVNGDGYDDVVVGAPQTGSLTGSASLYLGSAAGLSETPDLTLSAPRLSAQFGFAVAGAGDVDGDGYDDVLVSAPDVDSETDHAGPVLLFHGSAMGPTGSVGSSLVGVEVDDLFGYSLAGAGDVDGDGYDDVLVGAEGLWRRGRAGEPVPGLRRRGR